MIIQFMDSEDLTAIKDLRYGDTFYYEIEGVDPEENIYMVCDTRYSKLESFADGWHCLNLATGRVENFHLNDRVIKVKTILQVEKNF